MGARSAGLLIFFLYVHQNKENHSGLGGFLCELSRKSASICRRSCSYTRLTAEVAFALNCQSFPKAVVLFVSWLQTSLIVKGKTNICSLLVWSNITLPASGADHITSVGLLEAPPITEDGVEAPPITEEGVDWTKHTHFSIKRRRICSSGSPGEISRAIIMNYQGYGAPAAAGGVRVN